MLDTAVLKQLNDPDPAARKQAVIALAKTLDEEALGYLATVHKKDRDPEIRKLAKKAGIYIRKHTRDLFSNLDSSSGNDGGAVSPFYEEVDLAALDEVDKPVKVSAMNIERANGLVERAMDADVRGDRDKAIEMLRKALKLNPNLKREPIFNSQAVSLTGAMSTELAIELLLKDEEKKKRGEGDGEDEATWGNAFIDLLIMGLVYAAIVGVTMYLTFAIILPPLTESMTQQIAEIQARAAAQGAVLPPEFSGRSASEIVQSLFSGLTITATLGYSAGAGFFSIFFFIIFYLFIHAMSRGLLGGVGSYPRLVTKATLPVTGVIVLGWLISLPATYLGLTNPEMALLPLGVSLGANLLFYRVLIRRISAAYGFGIWTASGAITLSYIGLGALSCGIGFLAISLLSSGIGVR